MTHRRLLEHTAYFSLRDEQGNAQTLPPEVETVTPYHVVEADPSSSTFKLALTPGGTPLSISDASASLGVFVDVTPIVTGGTFLPPQDSFGQVAYGARSARVSPQLIQTTRIFYALCAVQR